jgi:hypothetical protein
VPHAGHQFLGARTRGRRKRVAGVAEVVKVHVFIHNLGVRQRLGPQPEEVAAPQPAALRPDEHQTVRFSLREPVKMVSQVSEHNIRHRD